MMTKQNSKHRQWAILNRVWWAVKKAPTSNTTLFAPQFWMLRFISDQNLITVPCFLYCSSLCLVDVFAHLTGTAVVSKLGARQINAVKSKINSKWTHVSLYRAFVRMFKDTHLISPFWCRMGQLHPSKMTVVKSNQSAWLKQWENRVKLFFLQTPSLFWQQQEDLPSKKTASGGDTGFNWNMSAPWVCNFKISGLNQLTQYGMFISTSLCSSVSYTESYSPVMSWSDTTRKWKPIGQLPQACQGQSIPL